MILNRKLYGNFKLPLNIFKSICFYSLYKEHTSGTLGESLQLMIFLTSRSSLKSYRKLIFVKSLYLDFKNYIANYLTDTPIRKLGRLLKILIPSWTCPEIGFLLLVAFSLISRTYADVFIIFNGTSIESSIISANTSDFVLHLSKYVLAMPFISLVNNSLKVNFKSLNFSSLLLLCRFEID